MKSTKDMVYETAKRTLGRLGLKVTFDRPFRNPAKLIALKAAELGARTMLDVGANSGQFARGLRQAGYAETIVSFEPLSQVHAELARAASRDSHWVVAPPMALGDVAGRAAINVSKNLASSSLLAVERRSVEAGPESGFVGVEEIDIKRLDDVIDPAWPGEFALKLDTQGFELHVLRGAPETLKRTVLVVAELSLVPLYGDGARFLEVFRFLEDSGFRCINLFEGFTDRARNEVLQVDGVFVRSANR